MPRGANPGVAQREEAGHLPQFPSDALPEALTGARSFSAMFGNEGIAAVEHTHELTTEEESPCDVSQEHF